MPPHYTPTASEWLLSIAALARQLNQEAREERATREAGSAQEAPARNS
jgi:hypothetical protein